MEGAGLTTVAGPPVPDLMGSLVPFPTRAAAATRPREDAAFHAALRRQEASEMSRRIRSAPPTAPFARDPGPARSVAADVPVTGDLLDLNVSVSCSVDDVRTGRVVYVSENAVVVADTANPDGLTAADYAHFGVTFDTLIHPVSVEHFGAPTDMDDNGRSILFFTRAVNELTPPDADVYTAGFFWSGDLFPEEDTPRANACPSGNQAEMFYLLTADPDGEAGMKFEADFIRTSGLATVAHEYQHLINASRRLWINDASTFERPWLNEGLSHVAEELMFYAAAGLSPGANLTSDGLRDAPNGIAAFNAYMGRNFSNLAAYMEAPDTASLMGQDRLATRGAAWSFLRYAADRSGRGDGAFFFDAVNGRAAGLEHLRQVLGEDPLPWMQAWSVALYADDAVPGIAPRHTLPSWNFRDLYPESSIEAFPLSVVALGDAAAHDVSLLPGGAVFARFGIGYGERGTLHVEAGGGKEPPSTLRGTFLRTR
ncbi:MAG TPA: hypothetical protein VK966_09845, partial [Longimicrobiales bacterium]|nr:hypothetical protein [Longimicrobiales bacterium]